MSPSDVTNPDILAIVSHDLKIPLTSILLSAETLARHAENISAKKENIVKIAETIRSQARRMDRIIDDLLELARLDSGILSMDFRSVNPKILVEDALNMFFPIAQSHHIRLENLSEPRSPLPSVRCDPQRILQVFSNIVGNSFKFTSAEKSVCIQACRENNRIKFSVTDQGPGISTQHLPHIFERFWQNRESTFKPGLGLGLYIAREIIKAHRGKIWAESEVGQGTTFSFTLDVG